MHLKLTEHFTRKEFSCKCGCGFDTVDAELLQVLSDLRGQFNSVVKINSGTRCINHNGNIGGSENSQHLIGRAADIKIALVHEDIVADYLEAAYLDKYGIGRYTGRTHIDTRAEKARWDLRIKST